MGGEKFKMNEELKKLLKEFKELTKRTLIEELEKAVNEKCIISVTKNKKGEAKQKIEGSTLSILITLAGLEKSILRELGTPVELYEMIKECVGTKEAK